MGAGNPSELAGVKLGDVVEEVNDRVARTPEELLKLLQETGPMVKLAILRSPDV